MDPSIPAFIESLWSRAQGVKATYQAVQANYGDLVRRLTDLKAYTATSAVQGQYQKARDGGLTNEMAYLAAILAASSGAGAGGLQNFQQILPGDSTPWSFGGGAAFNIGAVYSNPNIPFTTIGGTALNQPPSLPAAGATAQPFSVPKPYLDMLGFDRANPLQLLNNLETAAAYSIGGDLGTESVGQVNVCFQLPRVVAQYAAYKDNATYSSWFWSYPGFGLWTQAPNASLSTSWIDQPLAGGGTASIRGIWFRPDLTPGYTWDRTNGWGGTLYVTDGTNVASFHIPSLGVPANDAGPGGVTIAWNRFFIGVYLYRGRFGPLTPLLIAPYSWPYADPPSAMTERPTLLQTEVFAVGDPNVYHNVPAYFVSSTPGGFPVLNGLRPVVNFINTLVSEIDIEYVPAVPVPLGPSQSLLLEGGF